MVVPVASVKAQDKRWSIKFIVHRSIDHGAAFNTRWDKTIELFMCSFGWAVFVLVCYVSLKAIFFSLLSKRNDYLITLQMMLRQSYYWNWFLTLLACLWIFYFSDFPSHAWSYSVFTPCLFMVLLVS